MTGCLVQGYVDQLKKELPEVDAFLGSADYAGIAGVVKGLLGDKRMDEALLKVNNPVWLYDSKSPRLLSTPGYMAYLKIAEGCDHACAFCAIPKLRGAMRSRPVKDILLEAKALAAKQGVRELNLISQDTSEYGRDLNKGKPLLKELMEGLSDVEALRWVRLHYLYPAFLDDATLKVMQQSRRLVKYLDMPLQHADDAMLKAMKRPGDPQEQPGPGAAPARGRARRRPAQQLHRGLPRRDRGAVREPAQSFLEEAQLDRVGVFTYSQELLTPSGSMEHHVADKVKAKRQRLALQTAAAISERRLRRFKGQEVEVLVERSSRSAEAPAVDSVEHGTLAPPAAHVPQGRQGPVGRTHPVRRPGHRRQGLPEPGQGRPAARPATSSRSGSSRPRSTTWWGPCYERAARP